MDEQVESPRSEVEETAAHDLNTYLRVGPEEYEKFSSSTSETDRWA
jgi:hypothetical protein